MQRNPIMAAREIPGPYGRNCGVRYNATEWQQEITEVRRLARHAAAHDLYPPPLPVGRVPATEALRTEGLLWFSYVFYLEGLARWYIHRIWDCFLREDQHDLPGS